MLNKKYARQSTKPFLQSPELGLSHPLTRRRVCPSPFGSVEEGELSLAGEGVGEFQFRRLEKKLSTLPTLCFFELKLSQFKWAMFAIANKLNIEIQRHLYHNMGYS